MGYITDTYTLAPANAAMTSGTWYFPATSAYYFGGSDFTKGVIRLTTTATSAGTAIAVGLQSSPDGGTTWFPDAAGMADAAAYESQTVTVPTTTAHWEFTFSAFPGNLFRLGVLVTGGSAPVLVAASGDLMKEIPDNT